MRLLHKLIPVIYKAVILSILLISILNLTACFYQDDEYSPCHQPGTTWVSSDGRVTINIDENGIGTAKVDIDGTIYDFKYEEGFYYGSFIIRHSCYIYMEAQDFDPEIPCTKPEQIFEQWKVISYEKDRFTIRSDAVDVHYYIYNYNTVIEFHKVK